MTKKQVSIDPLVFEWPSDNPRLLAQQCNDCNDIEFPQALACPKCGSTNIKVIELNDKGTLWTWTSQEFHVKGLKDYKDAKDFKTYYLGYVELKDQIMVETRLLVDSQDEIKIGMPMQLEIYKFREEADGTETMGYGFRPIK